MNLRRYGILQHLPLSVCFICTEFTLLQLGIVTVSHDLQSSQCCKQLFIGFSLTETARANTKKTPTIVPSTKTTVELQYVVVANL
jgi:hypothetical protein